METIPTADDVYHSIKGEYPDHNSEKAMVEFAKLHVAAALKEASEKATTIIDNNSYCGNTGSEYDPEIIVDKNSILNAYPLTNIK